MRRIRIGAGAGYAGDRIEPALQLAEQGGLDYLVFECLAERTIALAHEARRPNPEGGYDRLLERRMQAVLPACRAQGIRIVTNAGAANPLGAARKIQDVARRLGLRGIKIAAVTGDDVLELVRSGSYPLLEREGTVADLGDRIVSANAYLGAESIVQALDGGADIVVLGRAADPALFLAPLIHEFGWERTDWTRLGAGTVVGHLLECAGQITGGYFADPGHKDVVGLARLGFPIGEVSEDGSVIVTKVSGTGGRVTEATCKEQLLYEIHDPRQYLTPDVVADFSDVTVVEEDVDRVRVAGGRGTERPEHLKVSVGYVDGFVGEGQISYAGPGAESRGRLALDIVADRLRRTGVRCTETRFELIGVDALHGAGLAAREGEPYEVRVRVVGRTDSLEEARRVGEEVETLYTNGPAGGGGARGAAKEVVAVLSTFIPRERVRPDLHILDT